MVGYKYANEKYIKMFITKRVVSLFTPSPWCTMVHGCFNIVKLINILWLKCYFLSNFMLTYYITEIFYIQFFIISIVIDPRSSFRINCKKAKNLAVFSVDVFSVIALYVYRCRNAIFEQKKKKVYLGMT
jgi:hypothetical protein